MSTIYKDKVINLNTELIEKLGEDKLKNPNLPVIDTLGYEKRLFEKERPLLRINSYIRLMLGLKDNDPLYGSIIIHNNTLEYSFQLPESVKINPEEFYKIFISAVEIVAKELKINPYSLSQLKKRFC